MTIETTSITSGPYTGNGLLDTYAYTFPITADTEITVYETDADGVETVLVLNTDYTVTGAGAASGTAIRTAGNLPTGYTWYIRSNIPLTQDTDFNSQGGFFPEIHEAALDKLTLISQQFKDYADRSLRFNDGYSGSFDTELPSPEPLMFFQVNPAGDGLQLAGSTTIVTSTDVINALDSATIITVTPATDDNILIKDTSDSAKVKKVTVQSILNLVPAPSNGGANVETISANKTLIASSEKLQKLTPTVFAVDAVAPDATTLTAGINVFKIYNADESFSLGFQDGAGNVLGFIAPETNTALDLSSISSAAGVWESSTTLGVMTENTDAVISPAGGPVGKMNRAWICYLSATRAIIVYCAPSTAYPTAVAVDLDTYELGTPFTISTNTNNSLGLAITNLTSTTAFVVYEDKKSVVLTLTDMTISAGTPNTTIGSYAFFYGAASGGGDIFFKLNSSQIVTVGGWGGNITVFNITITSGDTININSASTAVVSGDGYWGGDASLSKISDTSFLMSWQASTQFDVPHYDMSTVVTCAASSNPTFGTTGISVNIINRYVAPTCAYSATKFLQILNTSATTFTASVITVSGTSVSRGTQLTIRTDGTQGYTEQYLFRRRSAVDISTEMGNTTLARGASLYHCGGEYYITTVKPDTFDVLLADFTANTVTVDSTFTCTSGAGARAMITQNNVLLLLSYSGTTLTIERYQLDASGATAMADVVITGVPANPTGYSSGDVRIALYTTSYITLLDQNGELVGKGVVDPTIITNADDWPINKNGWMINLINGSSREIRTLRTI